MSGVDTRVVGSKLTVFARRTASPPKNDFVIAMPSDSASPEPSTSISATPPSTSTPPKIGKPTRPLSSKLPQRVPIKTPESDPNSGFGGLWYRQRTAGVHSSPGEAHTPKSLKAGRVVRERSPMRERLVYCISVGWGDANGFCRQSGRSDNAQVSLPRHDDAR